MTSDGIKCSATTERELLCCLANIVYFVDWINYHSDCSGGREEGKINYKIFPAISD